MDHARSLVSALALALGVVLSDPPPAGAHDPGLSALELVVRADDVDAHLTLARREVELLLPIDVDRDGTITAAEFGAARPRLSALAGQLVALSVAGRSIAPRQITVDLDASDAVHVGLIFPRPPGEPLVVHSASTGRLALGHRQYASARDARGAGRNAEGALVVERVLDAGNPVMVLPLGSHPGPVSLASFRQFLILGIEHIATGYDHVLFLVALLFGGRGFWALARTITAFTLAHSMTLALATLHVVRVPAPVVEPLIAASIVYVGVEVLLRHDPRRRWLLTFGFGLVHGLGFATALQDLGVRSPGGVALPLLAFNLGVELAQMAIALTVLPLVTLAAQRPRLFPPLARACSGLVIIAGTYWFLQRTVLP